MSMLAERKRKQKFSLNPRGKAWSEDSNKFGQKLLEKMGWSQGKGLGANEDGITEHVRVSYKNDSKGMGYKETEEWSQHEENYSTLLENLSKSLNDNKNRTTEIKVSSLEEKSKKSKARVHYKKFMRGKDLSRYTEKDLANIFGKKTLKPIKPEVKVEEPEIEKDVSRFGVDTVNAGSMTDYFKNKMRNFAMKSEDDGGQGNFGFGYKQDGENNEKIEEDECSEVSFGFGFGFKQEESGEEVKQRKRKKKLNDHKESESAVVFGEFLEESSGETNQKKKKRKDRAKQQ